MADEEISNNEGSGLNRRNFLKSAGVIVTGGALGAGLTLTTATAAASAAEQSKAAPKKVRSKLIFPTWRP